MSEMTGKGASQKKVADLPFGTILDQTNNPEANMIALIALLFGSGLFALFLWMAYVDIRDEQLARQLAEREPNAQPIRVRF
ncbi:MAG: hypothetical protein PVJ90_00405 [Pseudomonadales bacterium]|jgi:hypothetical protein